MCVGYGDFVVCYIVQVVFVVNFFVRVLKYLFLVFQWEGDR